MPLRVSPLRPSLKRKWSLHVWRGDYNAVRPHSSLQDRTPAAVGAVWVDSREAGESTPMNEIESETRDRFVTISLALFRKADQNERFEL